MFGDPFYHSTIRKTVIAFGSLFDSLYVVRTQDGNEIKIKVPITYAGKEKFLLRYKDTFNRLNQDTVSLQTILPRIGFEIGEIVYDPSRKKPSVNYKFAEQEIDGETVYNKTYTEVPYNMTFNLTAYVRYIDDGLQLAEQILPYFTPDFTVAIKQDVLGTDNEKMNIPFILNTVSQTNNYQGSYELDPRIVMWDFSFTAKINLFGPVRTSGLIKQTETNLYDMEEYS